MLFAGIDIGSNAARLLISKVSKHNGNINVEKELFIRVPLRLGMDVFQNNHEISELKIRKLVDTIKAYKLLIDVNEVDSFSAYATAAMRDATNSSDAINQVLNETGVKIKILSGHEEANIIASSDSFVMPENCDYSMFVDVGGGSTEITFLKNNKIISSNSFEIGTIRLLNKKTTEDEWDRMKKCLKAFISINNKVFCIGSGGNINKLVKLYGNRESKMITIDNLLSAFNHLNSYTVKERIEILDMRPDRADVIIPAIEIFSAVCKWSKLDHIYVPQISLADGIVHVLYKEYLKKKKAEFT